MCTMALEHRGDDEIDRRLCEALVLQMRSLRAHLSGFWSSTESSESTETVCAYVAEAVATVVRDVAVEVRAFELCGEAAATIRAAGTVIANDHRAEREYNE